MSAGASASKTEKPDPFEGRTIARCKVGKRAGKGRTSHVYSAHYEPLKKDIALKLLAGDLAGVEEVRKQFLDEARAIAKLDHENIVKVLDVVEDQGCVCILMEFVPGNTLQEKLDEGGAIPPRKAVRIALEMARALEAAHAEKVVHRDIKPANVILTDPGEQVKVVDFGLAGRKTLANRAGTPMYMSPEAAQGKRIDEKSDVYALGVCFLQMLTGKLPYEGRSVKEILRKHVEGKFELPSKVNSSLDTTYDDAIKKMLANAKGYRPSAAECVGLLEPFLADGIGADDGASRRGGAAGGRRRPLPVGKKSSNVVVILALVGLVVVIGALAMFGMRDPPVPDTPEAPPTPPSTAPGTPAGGSGISTEPATANPAEVAAKAAFDAGLVFATEHANAPGLRAEKWLEIARAHQGTEWGKKAADERRTAQEQADATAKIAEAERQKELDARKAERDVKANADRTAIAEFADTWRWDKASSRAAGYGGLSDDSVISVRKRKARLEFLNDRFFERVDQGIKDAAGTPARKWKPDAPGAADLTGATNNGLEWSDGSLTGTIPWEDLKDLKKETFDNVKKLLSSSDAEDQLFLAILAAELWHEEGEGARWSKMSREVIGLVDGDGSVVRQVGEYFENK